MNESEARIEYRKFVPFLKEWGQYIDNTLRELLETRIDSNRIIIYPDHRIKLEDSYIRKAFWRPATRSDNPIKMRDKVGTRIVMISYEDLLNVVSIFETERFPFAVKIKKKPKLDEPNEYQAFHVEITPNSDSPIFGDDPKLFNKLSCEVQIRTAVQDTLAKVAHETVYKGYHSYNSEIKNKFKEIVGKFTALELELLELENEMRTETAHITSFVGGLKAIGSEVFYGSFMPDVEDFALTESIYQQFHPAGKKIELDDLKKALSKNRECISALFEASQSYLLKQPISLFIIYLILTGRRSLLFKEWQYDEDVLRDICRYLGYSDESISH